MTEDIRGIIVEQLGVEPGEVRDEASFQEDLNADSLDLVELIMEMEDRFSSRSRTRTPRRSSPWATRWTT